MAIDPRNLKPFDLARLLNSTPLGTVIDERVLHRHRTMAGYRIGDGKRLDLFRYVAWLFDLRRTPKPVVDLSAEYAAMKERAAERNRMRSEAGRDIGELPEVINPERKARAENDFRYFCEVYFPLTFHLAWSPDHLKVIGKVEEAVLHGGLFALAMPRASGKTSIAECAACGPCSTGIGSSSVSSAATSRTRWKCWRASRWNWSAMTSWPRISPRSAIPSSA